MNRRRIVALSSIFFALGILGPLACSSPVDERRELPNGASGASGSNTSKGGALGGGGDSSLLKTDPAGSAGFSDVDGCKAQTEPARLTPVNIVFIIDKSGSMGIQDVNGDKVIDEDANEWDHSVERWNPVRDALVAFFEKPGAQGLAASLEFFPNGSQPTAPDTGVCRVGEYASPSVQLQSLDDKAKAELLINKIRSTKPGGGTPTLPAVQGALQYGAKLMTDDPGSQSVVVLVTDGEPGVADKTSGAILNEKCFCFRKPGCPDEDEIPLVVAAAEEGAKQGIPTYVIGMGEVDSGNLDMIAAAGGTKQAFIVSLGNPEQTQAEFTSALSSVRSVQGPCNIRIPDPPSGQVFDKLKVNVEYATGNDKSQPLYYAGPLAETMGGTQLSCPNPGPPSPSNPWFWTYDNEENPKEIVLCESACTMTSGDIAGRVNVVYGCAIRIK